MVKRSVVLIIAIVFIVGVIPAFTLKAEAGEKSLFQIAKDTLDKPIAISEKDKVRPLNLGKSFQEMSDYIDSSSAKARHLSLRGNKDAVAARRAGTLK